MIDMVNHIGEKITNAMPLPFGATVLIVGINNATISVKTYKSQIPFFFFAIISIC
jgi:hypothetical protein